ncbi:hypothetical protein H2200_013419 [Cladophialophora chaetospira]|uniref:Uncharacterized protein n=1 Tax=Cladophialophora chaetospira TaxID=386627 RepID=A0AA38TXL9_9EURO|nr:hypothetical protein H2200_013419 [Cladophialophora chaetospira]
MFQPEERYGKYAVVSEAASSDPGHRIQTKKARYYAPFSTRLPALAFILIAILGCIGALEYGLRAGMTVEEKSRQQTHTRLRRQDADASSSVAIAATTTAQAASASPTQSSILTELSTLDSSSYVSQTNLPVTSTPPETETDSTITGSAANSAYIKPTPTVSDDGPSTSTTVSSTMSMTMTTTSGQAGTGVYIAQDTPNTSTSNVISSKGPDKTTPSTTGYITPAKTAPSVTATTTTTAYVSQATTDYIAPTTTTTAYITPAKTKSSTSVYLTTSTTAYITPAATIPTSDSTGKSKSSISTSITSTIVMTSSTTAYVAQATTYVAQSTTPKPSSLTSGNVVNKSSSSKPTNPYTVPSGSTATSGRGTTSVTSSQGFGHDLTTALVASPGATRLTTTGSAGPDPTQTVNAAATTVETSGSYGVATGSPSAAQNGPPASGSKLYTTAITYTATDASGKVFTSVSVATYGVVLESQTVYDATGGLSTIVETLTSYSGVSNTGVLAQSTAIPTTPPDHQRKDEVELGLALSDVQYFRATYLPVVIAVILKLIWTIVFVSTKMMEPFYLLSRKGGASAKESLSADYLTTSLSLGGIKNMFVGHPIIILVSLVYMFLSILPSVATQSTTVRAIGWCRDSHLTLSRCNPMWYLNINYARALQAVLATIALIVFAMIIVSIRRRSGVFSNPSTIATVASLLNSEEFMHDLQSIDQRASRSSAKALLSPYRYMLGDHQTSSGSVRYGIIRTLGEPEGYIVDYRHHKGYSAMDQPSYARKELRNSQSTYSNRSLIDTIFLLSILALLGVLVGYYMDGQDDPFNNFFNHNSKSRFVLTCAASLIDIRWKQLEQEVRLLTPYRRLYLGSAKPESTILVSQNSTPLTSIFQALWRRNFFHAFVAFVAILSDVLIITVGGVPYNSAQIWLDFLVSIYASWAILAIMLLTVLAMFRWRALNEKMMMPREPTTLLRVLLLLCNEDNILRHEMQGYETLGPRERDDRVKARGGLYWAGWLTQPDGSQRWCVDKESGPGSGMNML